MSLTSGIKAVMPLLGKTQVVEDLQICLFLIIIHRHNRNNGLIEEITNVTPSSFLSYRHLVIPKQATLLVLNRALASQSESLLYVVQKIKALCLLLYTCILSDRPRFF